MQLWNRVQSREAHLCTAICLVLSPSNCASYVGPSCRRTSCRSGTARAYSVAIAAPARRAGHHMSWPDCSLQYAHSAGPPRQPGLAHSAPDQATRVRLRRSSLPQAPAGPGRCPVAARARARAACRPAHGCGLDADRGLLLDGGQKCAVPGGLGGVKKSWLSERLSKRRLRCAPLQASTRWPVRRLYGAKKQFFFPKL